MRHVRDICKWPLNVELKLYLVKIGSCFPFQIDHTCRACGSDRTNAIAADDGAHYRLRNCRVIKIYSRDMARYLVRYITTAM